MILSLRSNGLRLQNPIHLLLNCSEMTRRMHCNNAIWPHCRTKVALPSNQLKIELVLPFFSAEQSSISRGFTTICRLQNPAAVGEAEI